MASLSSDLFQTLRGVLTQLPSLLTLLACLVIAITRWKRHPRVSMVAALGLIFLILHGLFFSTAYIWITRWFLTSRGVEDSRSFLNLFGLLANFLFAVALGTLLSAVFIDRKQRLRDIGEA